MPKETFENLPSEKRERFIDAALEEFAANDYRDASISRIAGKAGIAKGSVYQYFADKRDLYLYLIDLGGRLKLDFIRSKQTEVDWSDFYEGFRSYLLLGAQFEFSGSRAVRLAALMRKALASDAWDESFSKMKAQSQAVIAGLVEQAMKQDQIRSDISVGMAAYYVNSLVMGIADYAASALGLSVVELADRLLEQTQGQGSGKAAEGPDRLNVLGLDFRKVIDDLISLMKGGLQP